MSTQPPEDVHPVSLTPMLIVEDDPATQERLREVLCALGCDEAQIAVADSVAGARSLLDTKRYSLAPIDIGLPDGSGVELIGWMHAHRPDTPAVLISAWRTEEDIFAALRAGAVGYLLKERDDLKLNLALRSIAQGARPSTRPSRAGSSAGSRRSSPRRPRWRSPMNPRRWRRANAGSSNWSRRA